MNKTGKSASVRTYLQLGKFSVIIPVSITAFTGFFLFNPVPDPRILLVTFGVLLQGLAASALNQLLEIPVDARMNRTMNRPLPSGKISRLQAALFVGFSLISGSLLIYLGGNFLAMILGIITLIWYNGVYTPLKKITAFAVIPGSLTGALPPVIGWIAAGGNISDKTSILLAFIFFIGQVPHFWLLILKYGNQYKNAGLPSLTDIFSIRQINNLTFIWITATLISALMLTSFGIIQNKWINIFLMIMTLAGVFIFRRLINNEKSDSIKKFFILLNIYYLILMILMILDGILQGSQANGI